MRIFLAEDNPADVFLLRQAFDLTGLEYELTVAQDGEDALDFVEHRGRHKTACMPDLIILDLNLPKSDGNEVLVCMRSRPEFRHIPILILTSSSEPEEHARTRRLGATSFFTKPADLDAYLNLGGTLLHFAFDGARKAHFSP